MATRTIIQSNGMGAPQPIEALIDMLKTHTLCPSFERISNFIGDCQRADGNGPLYPEHPDTVQFFGNFWDYSHVFCVRTDDPELIATLTPLIRANQATQAYQDAKAQEAEHRAYWTRRSEA